VPVVPPASAAPTEAVIDAEPIPRGQPELPVSTHRIRHGRRGAPRPLPGSLHLNTSRAEAAAQRLGEIAAAATSGARLGSKDELRAICGVSVGTFNEAIKLSLERGFVTSRPGPGGGIFAVDPPALAMLVTWFRAAARERSTLEESLLIRDELTPLFVDSAVTGMDATRKAALEQAMASMRSAVARRDVVDTIWDAWSLHKIIAESYASSLLTSLYLSLLDVGASYLRWALLPAERGTDSVPVWLGGFTEAHAALVDALCASDRDAAQKAMRGIDPGLLLTPPEKGAPAEAVSVEERR